MKFYYFFLLYVMIINIVFSNVLKSRSHEKKEDNLRSSIKAYFFISDINKVHEKIVLSDYVLEIEKDSMKFNSQNNHYILNYNEIQFNDSQIIFQYEEVLNMDVCRKEFQNSLQHFSGLHQTFAENKKGFFILFKKLIQLNNGTEKLRMVYIHPVNISTLDAKQNHLFFKLLQKKIYVNYLNQITSDNKYWKYQNFGESDHLKLLHWSEYLNSNKLFYDNTYTTLQAEGIVINEEKSFNILTVKYTFRYDQIINCDGEINDALVKKIDNENSERLSKNRCCISYDINWGGYTTTDLFCSKIPDEKGCKTEIEIFKKTILNKCVSIGIKQLFKTLSIFEFDFTSWIIKASSFDKIRFYNLFRILKENKILFFRNTYYFREHRNYLDYFAPFFNKYASLLELHGKGIFKMLKENIAKKPDIDNSMTSLEDDAAEKVMENLNSQSIENEMAEQMKQAVKKIVAHFPSFFSKVISYDMKLDTKIFEKYCVDDLDKNKVFYKHEIKKDLVNFVNNYNQNAKIRNEAHTAGKNGKCPYIDEQTKRDLFIEIVKESKSTNCSNDTKNIKNIPPIEGKNTTKIENSIKTHSDSKNNSSSNSQAVLIKIKKNTNTQKKHQIQNLHDMFHSSEDLNILKSFDRELINHPNNKLNVKAKDECAKEKEAQSAEDQKKNFILDKIKEQNMKNIASLINSKNYFIGIKAKKEEVDSTKKTSGEDANCNKTKDLLNKLKEKNMVPVDDSKDDNDKDDSNKTNNKGNGELNKFNKYFKRTIAPKNHEKSKCNKGKGEEEEEGENDDENNNSEEEQNKSKKEKEACEKLKNGENNDNTGIKSNTHGSFSIEDNSTKNNDLGSISSQNSDNNSHKNNLNGINNINNNNDKNNDKKDASSDCDSEENETNNNIKKFNKKAFKEDLLNEITKKMNNLKNEANIKGNGDSNNGNSSSEDSKGMGKACNSGSADANDNSEAQKNNNLDQSSWKKFIESQIDSKLQEVKKSLIQLESNDKQFSKRKFLRKLQSITKNMNNINSNSPLNPSEKFPIQIDIISKGGENLAQANQNNSSSNAKEASIDLPNSAKLAELIKNLNQNLVKIYKKDSNSNSSGYSSDTNSSNKRADNINNNIYINHHFNANNQSSEANGQSERNMKQGYLKGSINSEKEINGFDSKTDDDIIMENILKKQMEWQKDNEQKNENNNSKSNDSSQNNQNQNSNSNNKENQSSDKKDSSKSENGDANNASSKHKSEGNNSSKGSKQESKKNNDNGDQQSSKNEDKKNNNSKNEDASNSSNKNDNSSNQKENPNIPKKNEDSSKNNDQKNKSNGKSSDENNNDGKKKKNNNDSAKKFNSSENPANANNSTNTHNNTKGSDSKNSTNISKNKKACNKTSNSNSKKEESGESDSDKENKNSKKNNVNDTKRIYNLMSSGFLPNQYPLNNMEMQLQQPFMPNPFASLNNPIPNIQYYPNYPNLPLPPNIMIPANSVDFQQISNQGNGIGSENQFSNNSRNNNNNNIPNNFNNGNYPLNGNASENVNNYQAQNLNNPEQIQEGFLSNQQQNNYNNGDFNNFNMNPPLFNTGF